MSRYLNKVKDKCLESERFAIREKRKHYYIKKNFLMHCFMEK